MTHLMIGFLLEGPKSGPDVGKASAVGLLIVVLLLIGIFFLAWSMNRHLKRLPESFDTESPAAPEDATPKDATPKETTPQGSAETDRSTDEPGS